MVEAGLVDIEQPERNLLLLKPTAEGVAVCPTAATRSSRPGNDPGYDSVVYWSKRYAACQSRSG